MKIYIILFAIILSFFYVNSQKSLIPTVQNSGVYAVDIDYDIIYGYGLSHDSFNGDNPKKIPLKLDIYKPVNKSVNRPVIVLFHGGGFRSGDKNWPQYVNLCKFFASRGWVVSSVNYRLLRHFGSIPVSWNKYVVNNSRQFRWDQYRAVYPAHRDAKASIRWIVANQENLGINANYITTGGGSAGGVLAIGIGISDREDFKSEISIDEDKTLISTNLNKDFKVKTILNFWGSKSSVDAINNLKNKNLFNNSNPSLYIAHGTEDPTVLYEKAEDLAAIYTYTKVPFVLYPIYGKGHGPWRAKINGKSLEELAFKFIVNQQDLLVL